MARTARTNKTAGTRRGRRAGSGGSPTTDGLTERLRFERLLSELSSAFVRVSTGEVDTAIAHWLRRLVEALGVDRGGVSLVSADGKRVDLLHFYGVGDSPPPPTTLLHARYPWFVERVLKGEGIRIERIPDGIPADASAELAYAASVGLKSHLMLPLGIAGANVGALAFGSFRDYRPWPDELVGRLELVARVFGNALARKTAHDLLEERLGFERLIADLVKDLVNAQSGEIDGVITSALERLIGRFGIDRCGIARFAEDGALVFTHSASGPGVPDAPERIDVPWCVEELRLGRTVRVDNLSSALEQMPGPAPACARPFGAGTHLAIPLVDRDGPWGILGLAALREARAWTEDEVERLALVGDIVMESLQWREAVEMGRRQRDDLAHAARVAALGELATALAHELNRPLAAIRANAQATRRELARGRPPGNLAGVLTDIVGDATRAGDLILRLRALLRREELEKGPLAVNEVIDSVRSIAEAEVRRHGARIVFELSPGLPQVSGDVVQLQQVVLNLIRNAAEATAGAGDGAGVVVVRTSSASPEELTVSVADSGPAISDTVLQRMFTPFNSTKVNGLGMSLAISHSIIEAHGGRLWAERRPSGGLDVRFTLPAESDGPQ